MEKKKCDICGKEIDGYNSEHIDYLMLQHKLVHRKKVEEELKDARD